MSAGHHHRRHPGRRRWLTAGIAVAVAAIVAAVVVPTVVVIHRAAHRTSATRPGVAPTPAGPGAAPAVNHVVAGPDGPQASWVVTENDRPGSTGWQISGPQAPHAIEGYADKVAAQAGQQITLFVSTDAPTYTVQAWRMGYYHGAGGRLVWQSTPQPGGRQATCPVTAGINEVACAWTPSLTVPVTSAWVQGEYLLKLVGAGGQQSYVPLTVWDPTSTAAYVIMDGSLTDQVFNDYGGYDLYAGRTPCAPDVYPCSSRARVVSFDRPYLGAGDGGYLGLTYPLTRLAESRGLDVTYWTDLTLAEHGDQLLRHRALLSPGHDEEWSLAMRQATTAAASAGVNVAFFGASPVLRKVRLQPSPLGADREVVNYRDPQADPFYGHDNAEVSQNSWDQAPADAPPSDLVGATYIGYNNHASFPLVVTEPDSWLYAGTGLRAGATVPGVLRADFQAYRPGEPGPANVEIQAHSPVTVELHGPEYADTSYYTMPSGAGIWQSGTNGWIPALGGCTEGTACASGVLQHLTLNLLRVLGAGPLGERHPSRATGQ